MRRTFSSPSSNDSGGLDARTGRRGPVKGAAKGNAHAVARHIQHIGVGTPDGWFKEPAKLSGEINGISVFLDGDAGRPETLKDDMLQLL